MVKTQLTMLAAAKTSNERKAAELQDAIGFEVGAAVILGLAILLILLRV